MDTFMPWPAFAVWVWQASPAMKTRGVRVATSASSTSSNLSVTRWPTRYTENQTISLDVQGVGREHALRLGQHLLRGEPGVGGDLTHVDVQAEQVPALAGDEQDVACRCRTGSCT